MTIGHPLLRVIATPYQGYCPKQKLPCLWDFPHSYNIIALSGNTEEMKDTILSENMVTGISALGCFLLQWYLWVISKMNIKYDNIRKDYPGIRE